MSFTNPQRIINKQFDSFISSGQNLTNNIATNVEQMRQQVAKQKEYTKKLEQIDQQEGFKLRSSLNEVGTTGNRVLDENIQAFWNEKVDDYFKIKNAMQDGTITKQEGNRGLAQIMALVPQFKRQVQIIGAQSAAFKQDAANGNVSSIGSIENKSFLKRAGEGGNIGIVERGGQLYFFAPEEGGEPASMINGNELLTMENDGQNMYQTKPNLAQPGQAIFNKVIQPESLDSEHVEYIQVKKGDINPVTGKPFTNLEDGKIYTYRTITSDKKQGAIDAMQKSPAISSMIGNDNLMKRVWQDEIPDEEIERIAEEQGFDTSLYKDGWHETTKDMSEEQISKINNEQNEIMKTYLANKFYNDNATMDNTLKFVKEEVLTPNTKNEETGEPYYMDVVNDTMLFFEDPLKHKNLILNHTVDGKTVDDVQIDADGNVKLLTKDYIITQETGEVDENGEPITEKKKVFKEIGTYNPKDPLQQLILAQQQQRAIGGNAKDNLAVVQNLRRLYPELYKKRQQELSKKKQEKQTAFKDDKSYSAWKSSHPLNAEYRNKLSNDPRLAEALEKLETAGDDIEFDPNIPGDTTQMKKVAKAIAQQEFNDLEYEIWQELYDEQLTQG